MPVPGRHPKPADQKRHRNPLAEWIEVDPVPFVGGPPLPRVKAHVVGEEPPEPSRPLGVAGRAVWDSTYLSRTRGTVNADVLMVVCEQTDERWALRARVLQNNDRFDRQALRSLETQITKSLRALALHEEDQKPFTWPAETKRWWKTVSSMPHCVLWSEADWQFALDSAVVAAKFHGGKSNMATELRNREKVLGTTVDYRRALRIRYRGDEADQVEEDEASVIAMDAYRKAVR